MRKINLLVLVATLAFFASPALAGEAPHIAPTDELAVDEVTLDQIFVDDAVDGEGVDVEATEFGAALDGQAPLFMAGGSCGGVTCGKGTYCCNASCAWCRPYGVSCIQISCN